jgi:hypothetical protein
VFALPHDVRENVRVPRLKTPPTGLVLAAPILFAAAQVWTVLQSPPFWRQLTDPIYQYMLNGVAIVTGVTPGHTDHPGTSMQWLLGVTQLITHAVSGSDSTLLTDVVARPEYYLRIDALVLIALQLGIFLWVSLRLARHVSLGGALLFQAFVLSATSVFTFTYFPVPESLVWICSLALIGLLVPNLTEPRTARSIASLVLIGMVLAVGVTAKIIFVPLIALVVLWLRWRDTLIALAVSVVMSLALMWPVRSQFERMWEWFTATASTSARYPDEQTSGSGFSALASSPPDLLGHYPLAVVVILLVGIGLVMAVTGRMAWHPFLLRLIGPGVALGGLWVFTYKTWRPNDMMAMGPLLGLLAAAMFYSLFRDATGPRLFRGRILPTLLALVIAVVSCAVLLVRVDQTVETLSARTGYDDQVDLLQTRWEKGAYIATAYGVFNEPIALYFGSRLAGTPAAFEVARQYPRWLEFSVWTSMFYTQSAGPDYAPCQAIREMALSPQGLLLAPGRPMDLSVSTPQYESLTVAREALFDRFEVLRVIDVRCR